LSHRIDRSGFSARFKKLRLAKGLTLEQLAATLDLEWQSVHGWENGSVPRQRRWKSVADALSTSVDELFFGAPSESKAKQFDSAGNSQPLEEPTQVGRLILAYLECDLDDRELVLKQAERLARRANKSPGQG
jgi:transcriptional regulator with XRE-family HTH domain